MKVEKRLIEKNVYVASDDQQFEKKEDCVRHEAEEALKHFKGQCPYQCINELTTKEFIQDERTDVIAGYFKAIGKPIEIYKAEVKDEKDLEWLITFCKYRTGDDVYEIYPSFEVGKRYILCVVDNSTLLATREYIYWKEYDVMIKHYESLLALLREIF